MIEIKIAEMLESQETLIDKQAEVIDCLFLELLQFREIESCDQKVLDKIEEIARKK